MYLEGYQDLATNYRATLQGIPQEPAHHPEGDVLTHVKMVRKAIPAAVQELQRLKQDPSFGPHIADINFQLTPEEAEIVALAAWLHDIGKATATKTDTKGRVTSAGHEHPKHYLPQMEKLQQYAPQRVVDLYLKNKALVDFLIDNHMGFFSNPFVTQNFARGKVANTEEMKLLLVLMWADKMGRGQQVVPQGLNKNRSIIQASAAKSIERQKGLDKNAANVPFDGGPEQLAQTLAQRNVPRGARIQALRGKFPNLTDQEIIRIIGEGFRAFMEADQMQAREIPANIPVSQDVRTVADALRQGDQSVQVYIVGGAVRDFIYHQQHGAPGTQFKAKDEDVATNLSEEEIIQRLQTPYAVKRGISVKTKESVDTFGVVFVSVNGGMAVEVAPFRRDIGSADGRRPERVERGTIYDDAMRRDLTMNNLYYDFERGVILDFNPEGQGVEDVKGGVARPVGDPHQRFDEDKLRVLRLVRFFSRFNQGSILGTLDPKTLAAIQHFKQLNNFPGITPERIQNEFIVGIKQSQNTAAYLRNMAEVDLFQAIFPGLAVDTQTLNRLGNTKNPRVIIAWLLRQNQNVGAALNRLKYPNDLSDPVDFLVNAMNFGTDNAVDMVKNRDRRLLRVGKRRRS